MERVVQSNHIVFNQLEKFKEENAILKDRNDDLKSKIKADAKDFEILKYKVNEQHQIVDLAYEIVEDKTKECAEKQKELVDAQVKIVELNRRLEQFRCSSFNLNHLLNSQRNYKDLTGLGYSDVPPTHEFEGRTRVTSYSAMKEEDKKMYEAENKALSAITIPMPIF